MMVVESDPQAIALPPPSNEVVTFPSSYLYLPLSSTVPSQPNNAQSPVALPRSHVSTISLYCIKYAF